MRTAALPTDHRRLVVAASALAIVPIWVAALQAGFQHIVPTSDAALVVLRARDVFSGHPPLAGMLAAGASSSTLEVHFPGAIQLYLLAVPVRVFGNVWGTVLGMAAINTVWVVLLCRILWRRLSPAGVLLGIAFVTVFAWSIGGGYLITPIPMYMVMIPFLLFLFAVWSVADGDLASIPVVAVVANYLFLDHLVLVLLVPVIGLCAPIGLLVWMRERRRSDPDGHQARLRRLRNRTLTAVGITAVMWLPTVIQQLTTSPGNLRLLIASAGADRSSLGSWSYAVHVVIGVLARPPFWLRGSMERPGFMYPPTSSPVVGFVSVIDTFALVVFVAILIACGVLAIRRKDRQSIVLLGVAIVAIGVSIPNIFMAPDALGILGYTESLWCIAAFTWFAIATVLIRLLPRPDDPRVLWSLAAVCLVMVVLNLPTSSRYGGDPRISHAAATMNRVVVPKVKNRGMLYVPYSLGFENHTYGTAMLLALATAHVDFCVDRLNTQQLGHWRYCDGTQTTKLSVVVVKGHGPTKKGELLNLSLLTPAQRHERSKLRRRVATWLASQHQLTMSSKARKTLHKLGEADVDKKVNSLLSPDDGDFSALADNPDFPGVVLLGGSPHDQRNASALIQAGTFGYDLARWAQLEQMNKSLVVIAKALR